MQWADFGPYVLPYVIGCPYPTMELHAKLAAIEFCEKAKCWVKPLDPAQTYGQHLLEVDASFEKARIVDIQLVQVDGVEWPIVDPMVGIRRAQADDGRAFCFPATGGVMIYPLQPSGTSVVVTASLVPTLAATSLDALLYEHIDTIANGAIARIMRIPGQTFTGDTGLFEGIFREGIKTESSRLARGNIAVAQRATPSFM
jgi:hypothetical protein